VTINPAMRAPIVSVDHSLASIGNAAAGMSIASDVVTGRYVGILSSAASLFEYDLVRCGAITQQTNSLTLTGTFGAGACITSCAPAASVVNGAASSASSMHLISAVSAFMEDAVGSKVRFISGSVSGEERTIVSVVPGSGTNGTIFKFDAPLPSSCSGASFLPYVPHWVALNAGTMGVNAFKLTRHHRVMRALSVTGFHATNGTGGMLCATPSVVNGVPKILRSGAVTSVTDATTISCSLAMNSGALVNSQIRFTTGPAKGAVRRISANTTTDITMATLSAAYGDYPATSLPGIGDNFVIEPCDDFVYYVGNASNVIYRYSFVDDAWTSVGTLLQVQSAAVAIVWLHDEPATSNFSDEAATNDSFPFAGNLLLSDTINGFARYNIATGVFDHDIFRNVSSTRAWGPGGVAYSDGMLYYFDSTVPNRIVGFNTRTLSFRAVATLPTTVTAVAGSRLFLSEYSMGGVRKKRLGAWASGSTLLYWVHLD
jgi:hypothetical protein